MYFFFWRSKHIQRKAHAFRGRHTLKDVERQLRNELNKTKMYSNVTEMDASIEDDTSPLVSGVFVHRAFCAYFLRIERVVEMRRFLWWTRENH